MFGIGKAIKRYIKSRNYRKKEIICEPIGSIGKRVVVERNVKIGKYTYVISGNIFSYTEVGRYCSISSNVSIGGESHPLDWLSTSPSQYDYLEYNDKKRTIIGNDVWIGTNVCIKAGITIGTGAVVGAGAVVVKDIPPYAIVAGVPARVLRYRFDEGTISQLLASKWWEKDIDELKGLPFNDVKECLKKLNLK